MKKRVFRYACDGYQRDKKRDFLKTVFISYDSMYVMATKSTYTNYVNSSYINYVDELCDYLLN